MKLKNDIETTKKILSKRGHVFERLKYKSGKPEFIGNFAKHDLHYIVYAYSVGLKELYQEYLYRCVDWLTQSIEKETLGEFNYHQYRLTSALAFANWIKTGDSHIKLWKNSLKWQNKIYGDMNCSKNIGCVGKDIITLQMLTYFQAQEYEKTIQLYQSKYGDKPFKLNKNMGGIRVAYAYCLHFYENKFTVEQLENASRGFLEKELVMLYTMGRPTEMLYWLKMVCDAREKDYTPEEVIYSFYEYIPEQEKPDFVKELLGEKESEKKSFFSSIFKW